MIPQRLALSGSIGIRAGLGLETLILELNDIIPEDAITVAIRGDNGIGKSTILNLGMTPWRNPPQIAGNAYQHFGDKGIRILDWTHNGERYRSTIEYRCTDKTRTQKAYLHVLNDINEWEAYRMEDRTTSDGKTSTYDQCLENILGPQNIYFLSAFRAQNASQISDLDDPKGIMRDLLALDEPARLSKLAMEVSRGLHHKANSIYSITKPMAGQTSIVDRLHADLAEIESGSKSRNESRAKAEMEYARAKAELDRAMAEGMDIQRLIDKRNAICTRLNDVKMTATDRDNEKMARIESDMLTKERTIAGFNQRISLMKLDISKTEFRIGKEKELLNNREEIERAENNALLAQQALSLGRQTQKSLAEKLGDIKELKQKKDILIAEKNHLEYAIDTDRKCLDGLNYQMGYIDSVPCGGVPPYDKCPALQEAMNARDKVEAVEILVDERQNDLALIEENIEVHSKSCESLTQIEFQLKEATLFVESKTTELQKARDLAAKRDKIDAAESAKREYEKDIEEIKRRITEESETHASFISEIDESIKNCLDELEKTKNANQIEIDAIEAELADTPVPNADDAINSAKNDLQKAQREIQSADNEIATAVAAKAQYEAEIKSISSEIRRNTDLREKSYRIGIESAQWKLLSIALTGVIDLTIESAGPGIAAIANRLLKEAYGPRFSVRIVTQRQLQNGNLIECFDISIIDSETGVESSMRHKSGGECVWLDKALTDAIAIYHQDASGTHYECMFADETEDGLTEERKHMFYAMDRAALKLGGYSRKFSVSHNPRAWELADHVIDLSEYRSN